MKGQIKLPLDKGRHELCWQIGRAMVQGIAAALAAFLVFSLVDCSWTGSFTGGSFMHINLTIILLENFKGKISLA